MTPYPNLFAIVRNGLRRTDFVAVVQALDDLEQEYKATDEHLSSFRHAPDQTLSAVAKTAYLTANAEADLATKEGSRRCELESVLREIQKDAVLLGAIIHMESPQGDLVGSILKRIRATFDRDPMIVNTDPELVAEAGPHEFAPLGNFWHKRKCRHCFYTKAEHPITGWVPARPYGDRR